MAHRLIVLNSQGELMSKRTKTILILYMVLMAVIYADLMIFHRLFSAKVLEYTAIVLCLATLLILPIRKADWLVVTIALGFTLIADTFLVLLEGYQIIATTAFCVTQSLYAVRLRYAGQNRVPRIHQMRIILFVLLEVVAFLVLRESFNALVFITMLYLSLLVGNIIHAVSFRKEQWIFSVALVLFLLCDVVVGLSVSGEYLNIIPESLVGKILDLPINLAWLFYLPSQVLIVLSVYFKPQKHIPMVQ